MGFGKVERSFDGLIEWYRSSEGAGEFPCLIFRADVDFATTGLVSLTSTKSREVVAARMTTSELARADFAEVLSAIEDRVNGELGRDDLRIPRFLRVEPGSVSAKGLSFREYSENHVEPTVVRGDILAPGEAVRIRRESIDVFLGSGGTIVDHTRANERE